MSRFHNPEFTQIELYVAYKDYKWMMNLVEEMVEKIAIALHGKTEVQAGNNVINFQRPWKRYRRGMRRGNTHGRRAKAPCLSRTD